YRPFVVWNRNWVISLSFFLLSCGSAVQALSGYTVTHLLLLAGEGNLFISKLAPWALSFFSMSRALNVLCTILIAGRILWTHMRVRTMRSGKNYAATALTESAALYSLSLTVLLVLYDLGLNTQYIMLDWTTSLIGIAFSLIIYRLATNSSKSTSTSRVGSRPGGPNSSYPLTSVNVSRIVEATQDSDKVYDPERSMDNKPAHGESWVAM
ncbi:hypothetical protein R3P38DRAFT_3588250, partial [Favolaschia claudopus]